MRAAAVLACLLCVACAATPAPVATNPKADACLWRVLREAGSAPATSEQLDAVARACR
jgi:hypothetical protein